MDIMDDDKMMKTAKAYKVVRKRAPGRHGRLHQKRHKRRAGMDDLYGYKKKEDKKQKKRLRML